MSVMIGGVCGSPGALDQDIHWPACMVKEPAGTDYFQLVDCQNSG